MQEQNATTVLVPLDGSELAESALPYAEAVATSLGLDLRLISVVDTGPDSFLVHAESERNDLVQAERETRTRYLEMVRRPLDERGRTTSTMVLEGDPVEQILAAAGEAQIAALVIATHGRGGIQRLYLGSVADKVMRLGAVPTLMVAAQEPMAARPPVQLHRIVVPLDGSSLAEAALPLAERLAAANKATLALVRVQPLQPALSMAGPYVPDLGEIQSELERAAGAYLETIRKRIGAGIPVETMVLRGSPALELVDYMHAHAPDLVVMTTRGRGGLKRMLLGSTADRLVRSGLPVLLIRDTAD